MSLHSVSGLEGGRGWLLVRGDAPERRHRGNDTQLLWLEPPQPEQCGFTSRHLPETVLVPRHGAVLFWWTPWFCFWGAERASTWTRICRVTLLWKVLQQFIVFKGIMWLHSLILTFEWFTQVNVLTRCLSLNCTETVLERPSAFVCLFYLGDNSS